MFKKILPFLFLFTLLTACSPGADTPRQIATYPLNENQTYIPPPDISPTAILVYDASLALTVWSVEDAANSALQKAADYGGYLSSSNTWTSGGQTYAILTFALPAGNYDRALNALKRLGTVTQEQVSGQLYPYSGQSGWDYTSHITLNLSQRFETVQWPSVHVTETRPLRTFSAAFGVLVGLLGFLLDVAIWLVVVVGPFLLIGWGIRRLIKGGTQPSQTEKASEPEA
ncbi:MAG TPA: DUF4349 domain-containing protein [Anaerolineales bacterium]|nr:DUF4349 domain-containing protein [Anaerolineales bacterium]